MSAADKRLQSIVDRIERLEEERAGVGGDIKDIYTEAKGAGYKPKALRRLIAERKRKDEDEIAAEVDLYRAALGMPKATYRSVAEQLGVSKSKLQRLVPREEKGTSATTETADLDTPPGGGEASADERAVSASSSPPESCGVGEGPEVKNPAMPLITASPGAVPPEPTRGDPSAANSGAGIKPGPQEPDWDAIIATQPTQLRRMPA